MGSDLVTYVVACLGLLIVPGPSVLYIVTRSLEGGRRAGLISALGIATGTVGHVLAAAFGLSALLAGSPVAYTVLRFAGAAYLVYLGIRRILDQKPPTVAGAENLATIPGDSENSVSPPGPARVYRDGILVNLLNPKTTLFFLAFLPQFVDPGAGPVAVQIVVLGFILIGLGALSDGTYAVVAGTAGVALTRSPHFRAVARWGAGAVYLGLGAFAVIAGG